MLGSPRLEHNPLRKSERNVVLNTVSERLFETRDCYKSPSRGQWEDLKPIGLETNTPACQHGMEGRQGQPTSQIAWST